MMKRNLSVMLAALLFLALLAACGSGDSPSSGTSSEPSAATNNQTSDTSGASSAPAPQESQKITMAHIQGEWSWPMLDAIVDEYKTISGNEVELIYVPADGMSTWMTTQFAADTATDIIFDSTAPVADFYKNGWTVDLKPYLEAPSAYTGDIWMNSFRDGALDGVIDPNGTGAMLGLRTTSAMVNFYYNKDVFERFGIDTDSTLSWTGVLEVAKKIKESDPNVIPISVQNSIGWNLTWIGNFMMEQLWYDVVPALDIVDVNGGLQQIEVAAGIKAGIINLGDQRMTDYFRFLKELSNYFNTGFNSASWEYEALFNESQSAMTINGSWFPNQAIQNELTVNYGTGPIPFVDSAISDKAENRVRKYSMGPGGVDMFVTTKAFNEGRGEAAIDFLQYFSDPNTGAKKVTEQLMWIPVVKGVDVPEAMKGITDYIGDEVEMVSWNANVLGLTAEANDRYHVMLANFLDDDSITPEKMTQDFAKLYEEALDEAIANHPEWGIDSVIAQFG